MKTKLQRPFEDLGVYVLPLGAPGRVSACVIMHMEIIHRVEGRRIGASIATAMLLFGKRDAINGRKRESALLGAKGITQSSTTD